MIENIIQFMQLIALIGLCSALEDISNILKRKK